MDNQTIDQVNTTIASALRRNVEANARFIETSKTAPQSALLKTNSNKGQTRTKIDNAKDTVERVTQKARFSEFDLQVSKVDDRLLMPLVSPNESDDPVLAFDQAVARFDRAIIPLENELRQVNLLRRARRQRIVFMLIGITISIIILVVIMFNSAESQRQVAISLTANAESTRVAIQSTQNQQATATQRASQVASAYNPVTYNAGWLPITSSFSGVEMVLVPAGCFMMGSTNSTIEQPIHEQCFTEPFWIDRTEVTNVEYQRFIDAGGYTNAAYWTDEGWQWRTENNIITPDNTTGFTGPNQPRVGISWYEAIAYTNWRSERDAASIQLPSEPEWEYAARGPDSLNYPWGNDFAANNLVYSANSNRQTAEVGSRPSGTSWVDALDMSGNVWEWTRSVYDETSFLYPYIANDIREDMRSSERRVIRSGSWRFVQDYTLSSFRFSRFINSRLNTIGFRCVRPASA